MNYQEALEKIHSFEVFGSRLGLDRMKKLLSLLGSPEKDLNIIHVAGTNGKGSVCRYVYSVLQAAGYRCGCYISPFVERFTERIECNGQEISEEALARHTETVCAAVDQMLAEGFESPTEFEVVTAIGLLYFAAEKTDFVILEVGLGGRGDSTNICDTPLATAITSIDFDHMGVLGDTLEQIAWDKAGITKADVPMIAFVKDEAARDVIRREAEEKGAPFIDASQIRVTEVIEDVSGYTFSADFPGDTNANAPRIPAHITLGMPGRHQVENAIVALLILQTLQGKGICISEDALRRGMASAKQPVRFEVFPGEPPFILDGAHNEAGVRALVRTAGELLAGKKILLCTGILGDKEYEKMAGIMGEIGADMLITRVPVPRGMSSEELAEAFRQKGCRVTGVFEDYAEAFRESTERASDYDTVIWAGSIYLVGAIRTLVKEYRNGRSEGA